MTTLHFILAAGWLLYCAIHSITADPAVKTMAGKLMGKYYPAYRLCYSLVALLLLIPLAVLHLEIRSPRIFPPATMPASLGLLAMTGGLAGMGLCLRKYLLTGARGIFMEGGMPPLQQQGLHALARHPLYLFTFIFIWGLFLNTPTVAVLIADTVITAYTLLAIRSEERKLVRIYGSEYEAYQAKTPMIIPRLTLMR